jgi:hypothetical protein
VITVRPIREEHGEDRLTLNSADRLADVNHQRQMSKVKMRPHYNLDGLKIRSSLSDDGGEALNDYQHVW